MSLSRRKFLTILGGGTVFAASAGAGGFLATRSPSKALQPWGLAGQYDEPRRRALSYAILAPNPHNRQPWLVDLSQKGRIIVYVDPTKDLPHTDPFDRQITIGLGCFLELTRLAAAQDGYRADITPFPEGFDATTLDTRPVAIIDIVKDTSVTKDPLFAHVLERRSLKTPFDMTRPVGNAVLGALEDAVDGLTQVGSNNSQDRLTQLRELTHSALTTELTTPATYKESVDLFRIGKAEANANPDGLYIGGPMIDSLAAMGQFSREIALDKDHYSYQMGIDAALTPTMAAMAHVWIITDTNTRLDQLKAGAAYIRLNLAATAQGVGMHPHSQALQEYDAMQAHYGQLHQMIAPEGGRVQMLAALGYGDKVTPTPRWPIEAKIL